MITCGPECTPCCDFCIHCLHDEYEDNGKIIVGSPIGCILWNDDKHQDLVIACAYCNDFHCFRAKGEK